MAWLITRKLHHGGKNGAADSATFIAINLDHVESLSFTDAVLSGTLRNDLYIRYTHGGNDKHSLDETRIVTEPELIIPAVSGMAEDWRKKGAER